MNNEGASNIFQSNVFLIIFLPSQPRPEVGTNEGFLVLMLSLGSDGPVVCFILSVNHSLNSGSVETLII